MIDDSVMTMSGSLSKALTICRLKVVALQESGGSDPANPLFEVLNELEAYLHVALNDYLSLEKRLITSHRSHMTMKHKLEAIRQVLDYGSK